MIYNVENTAMAGRPVKVFDANGLEWTHCVEADPESGRIVRLKTNAGRFVISERGDIERETMVVAAPLLIVKVRE